MTNRRSPGPPSGSEGYHHPGEPRGYPGDSSGRGRAPKRAPAPTSPVMLVLTYGGVGLLAIAVMAITFFVMAPPTDFIRNEIVKQVKRETGRELTISGPASFTIFPSLGVRIA